MVCLNFIAEKFGLRKQTTIVQNTRDYGGLARPTVCGIVWASIIISFIVAVPSLCLDRKIWSAG